MLIGAYYLVAACLSREILNYWLALSENSTTKGNDVLLLSFDFTTERYQRPSLPFQNHPGDTIALSVVREEQLSVLHWSFDTLEMEIWVSTKIETTAVWWSSFLKLGIYNIPYCLWSLRKFLHQR